MISREELGNHFLALADQEQIDEIGNRFGIEENGGAARDDQRPVAIGAIGAAHRNARHPQHRDDIEIVGLERNRKREDVELAQRARLLERDEALAALAHRDAFVSIGKKGAFGRHQRIGFKDMKHGLEAEIRHPEPIDVRIDDADGNIATGTALIEHLLAGEAIERALTNVHSEDPAST